MSVIIKTVSTRKELKQFVRFANRLYKGHPYYVPCMPDDDMTVFNREKNGAFDFCEAELYLAYKNDELVGRVAAIVNNKANEAWKVKQVRFGWIDFVDDLEVSAALLDAVSEFGRRHGMTSIVGPLGFTDFDPEGMLVEGFDRMGTMAMIYNHPYYPEHMVKHGYVKETDWMEFRIRIPETLPERHQKLAQLVMERNKLRIVKKTRKQIRDEKYGHKLFRLINDTYCILYGYSLLSEKQIDSYVDQYLGLLDLRMVSFIEDEHGELVAAGVTMPSLSDALQKCNGEILPFGWWHLVKNMYLKKPETVDLLLIGVKPELQNKGVTTLLFQDLFTNFKKLGFKYAETSAELETNTKVQAMWRGFDNEQHKRRRVFGKEL